VGLWGAVEGQRPAAPRARMPRRLFFFFLLDVVFVSADKPNIARFVLPLRHFIWVVGGVNQSEWGSVRDFGFGLAGRQRAWTAVDFSAPIRL
jgi:hypothetical protein